ncbi:MFS transporter [Vagococcus xieshaowenii]|uniref:MFS transporter n=1 Tax=Vagococcus xieshaowenii TaxID=2562451 RepID=A0A4Z0DBS8_9ENTE|nr:MFS transporter [Vagococcus xieshaowenii]QCA28296.1 MFS transporter [Vagococcus xieshaowenii]TFZ42316.1 MFS transporter [Vagococcus xieshaowenii]
MNQSISTKLTFLMSLVCGISIACLYYIQPLEQLIAHDLKIAGATIGMAPMLSQMGYALGLLFIVPLGDKLIRKKLIITMLLMVSCVQLLIAKTQQAPLLLALMLLIGITAIIPQIIIPFAGELASDKERGKVLGVVTGGLLVGILLSRTYSGIIGSLFGWRAVYLSGVVLSLLLIVLVYLSFPTNKPHQSTGYFALIRSLPHLFVSQKKLQKSAINGFLMFGSFNIFWSTLIFYMSSETYHLGSKEVGYMGLVGVVGALASVFMGSIVDKKGAMFGVNLGTTSVVLSFILLWLTGSKLALLVIGTILLDFGVQSAQVSNQTVVQGLSNEFRSRNNTVFMFFYFIGGATGSFLGTLAWHTAQWSGVCLLGLVFAVLALVSQYLFKNI